MPTDTRYVLTEEGIRKAAMEILCEVYPSIGMMERREAPMDRLAAIIRQNATVDDSNRSKPE